MRWGERAREPYLGPQISQINADFRRVMGEFCYLVIFEIARGKNICGFCASLRQRKSAPLCAICG